MLNQSGKPKRPRDANQLAFQIVQESIGEPVQAAPKLAVAESGKNPAAVELGRPGGLKGGKARTDSMTAEERSALAKKAAAARWGKK